MSDLNDAEVIRDLSAALPGPEKPKPDGFIPSMDGVPYTIVPEGYELHELERLLPAPARIRANPKFTEVQSFIDYVKRFATDSSMMYGKRESGRIVAIIDENGAEPRWRQHTASFEPSFSDEWTVWNASDGKEMGQEVFARFIEDNAPDIHQPTPADMLELSRTFQAKKKVNFRSGVRLDSGENQLVYEEEIQGAAGAKGQVKIPETFTIAIPVLAGSILEAVTDAKTPEVKWVAKMLRYPITARLRYRIRDNGPLALWYDLLRPEKVRDTAVEDAWKAIREQLAVTMLIGAP